MKWKLFLLENTTVKNTPFCPSMVWNISISFTVWALLPFTLSLSILGSFYALWPMLSQTVFLSFHLCITITFNLCGFWGVRQKWLFVFRLFTEFYFFVYGVKEKGDRNEATIPKNKPNNGLFFWFSLFRVYTVYTCVCLRTISFFASSLSSFLIRLKRSVEIHVWFCVDVSSLPFFFYSLRLFLLFPFISLF